MIVLGLVNPKHFILAYRKHQFQKEIQTKLIWCMCPRFVTPYHDFAHICIYIYIYIYIQAGVSWTRIQQWNERNFDFVSEKNFITKVT